MFNLVNLSFDIKTFLESAVAFICWSWPGSAEACERRPPHPVLLAVVGEPLLVARASGYRFHHVVEAESAGLLARRKFAEALQPFADIGRRGRDHEHVLYPPVVVAEMLSYSARSNGSMRKLASIGARSASNGDRQTSIPSAFCFRNVAFQLL